MKRFVAFCAAAALFAAPALAAPAPESSAPESTRETAGEQIRNPDPALPETVEDDDGVAPGSRSPTAEDVGMGEPDGTGGSGFEEPTGDREIRRQPSSGPADAAGGSGDAGGATPESDSELEPASEPYESDRPDHQSLRDFPGAEGGGVGGSGEEGSASDLPASDFEPVPDEALRGPTEDPSIMGNEGNAPGRPAADDAAGTGGAGDAGESGNIEDEGSEDTGQGGAVFDTGDTSGRQPGLIPEGDEPGPGSPLPSPSDVR